MHDVFENILIKLLGLVLRRKLVIPGLGLGVPPIMMMVYEL
jgi:hypothetical protein